MNMNDDSLQCHFAFLFCPLYERAFRGKPCECVGGFLQFEVLRSMINDGR